MRHHNLASSMLITHCSTLNINLFFPFQIPKTRSIKDIFIIFSLFVNNVTRPMHYWTLNKFFRKIIAFLNPMQWEQQNYVTKEDLNKILLHMIFPSNSFAFRNKYARWMSFMCTQIVNWAQVEWQKEEQLRREK